jgi:hypothetical protein
VTSDVFVSSLFKLITASFAAATPLLPPSAPPYASPPATAPLLSGASQSLPLPLASSSSSPTATRAAGLGSNCAEDKRDAGLDAMGVWAAAAAPSPPAPPPPLYRRDFCRMLARPPAPLPSLAAAALPSLAAAAAQDDADFFSKFEDEAVSAAMGDKEDAEMEGGGGGVIADAAVRSSMAFWRERKEREGQKKAFESEAYNTADKHRSWRTWRGGGWVYRAPELCCCFNEGLRGAALCVARMAAVADSRALAVVIVTSP